MTELCDQLHRLVREGQRFDLRSGYQNIPLNGVYIMFEKDEYAHGGDRIVRIGTHTGSGQLRSRIWQHFENENKNRSIFRKNIGRCLLNKENHPYLEIWELDTTSRKDKEKNLPLINKAFEAEVEKQISSYIQASLSFCVLEITSKEERLYFEKRLISTVAGCTECSASPGWMGKSSPIEKIKDNGLWQVQGLKSPPLSQEDLAFVSNTLIRPSQTISKQALAEHLYFLNRTIKDLQTEIQINPDNDLLRRRIRELYELKTQVLLKLLAEGHISVSTSYIDGCQFYTFTVNKMFAFHMPKSPEIKEAVMKYGKKRKHTHNN